MKPSVLVVALLAIALLLTAMPLCVEIRVSPQPDLLFANPANMIATDELGNKIERLRDLLAEDPLLVNRPDEYTDFTPIMAACSKPNAEVLRFLVAHGADLHARMPVDNKGFEGWGVLHVAAMYGHPENVQVLLELGADPRQTDALGKTPLFYWSYAGDNQDRAKVIEILKAATSGDD